MIADEAFYFYIFSGKIITFEELRFSIQAKYFPEMALECRRICRKDNLFHWKFRIRNIYDLFLRIFLAIGPMEVP